MEDLESTRQVLHSKVDSVILNLSEGKAKTLAEFEEFATNAHTKEMKNLVSDLIKKEIQRLYKPTADLNEEELVEFKKTCFQEFRELYDVDQAESAESEMSDSSVEEGSKVSNLINDDTEPDPTVEGSSIEDDANFTIDQKLENFNSNMEDVVTEIRGIKTSLQEAHDDIELVSGEIEKCASKATEASDNTSENQKKIAEITEKILIQESSIGLLEDLSQAKTKNNWKDWTFGRSDRAHDLAAKVVCENLAKGDNMTLATFANMVLEISEQPHEQTLIWIETIAKGVEKEGVVKANFLMSQVMQTLHRLCDHVCTVTTPSKSSVTRRLDQILKNVEGLQLERSPTFTKMLSLKMKQREIETISEMLQNLGNDLPNYYGRLCLDRRNELTMKVRDMLMPSAGKNIPSEREMVQDDLPSDSDGNEEQKVAEEKLIENFSKENRTESEKSYTKKTAKKRKVVKESVASFLAKRRARELGTTKLLPSEGMNMEKIRNLKTLEKAIKK